MSALLDRYWTHYGSRKRSASREKSVIAGIRATLGRAFVREVDGGAIARWYEDLTAVRGLSAGAAVRHFNVMHHMMEKAATIWSKETGIDRNPADQIEVKRPRLRLKKEAEVSVPAYESQQENSAIAQRMMVLPVAWCLYTRVRRNAPGDGGNSGRVAQPHQPPGDCRRRRGKPLPCHGGAT